mmetsp:Transcript_35692/g.75198  ORF Transcript_35692/g.75198 Transcript_35692/m.75198 type:complete len:420 (+) Transcript_35692:739-1998(+)
MDHIDDRRDQRGHPPSGKGNDARGGNGNPVQRSQGFIQIRRRDDRKLLDRSAPHRILPWNSQRRQGQTGLTGGLPRAPEPDAQVGGTLHHPSRGGGPPPLGDANGRRDRHGRPPSRYRRGHRPHLRAGRGHVRPGGQEHCGGRDQGVQASQARLRRLRRRAGREPPPDVRGHDGRLSHHHRQARRSAAQHAHAAPHEAREAEEDQPGDVGHLRAAGASHGIVAVQIGAGGHRLHVPVSGGVRTARATVATAAGQVRGNAGQFRQGVGGDAQQRSDVAESEREDRGEGTYEGVVFALAQDGNETRSEFGSHYRFGGVARHSYAGYGGDCHRQREQHTQEEGAGGRQRRVALLPRPRTGATSARLSTHAHQGEGLHFLSQTEWVSIPPYGTHIPGSERGGANSHVVHASGGRVWDGLPFCL